MCRAMGSAASRLSKAAPAQANFRVHLFLNLINPAVSVSRRLGGQPAHEGIRQYKYCRRFQHCRWKTKFLDEAGAEATVWQQARGGFVHYGCAGGRGARGRTASLNNGGVALNLTLGHEGRLTYGLRTNFSPLPGGKPRGQVRRCVCLMLIAEGSYDRRAWQRKASAADER